MANEAIKRTARESGVKLWQVAERWGCTDGNFSRKLRRPFSQADERRALAIIDEIRREAEKNAANADNFGGREVHPGG